MKLQSTRLPSAGFALMEAMIAFALLAGIVVAVTTSLVWSSASQNKRVERYWLTEFARSIAEEYVTTYPKLAPTGSRDGGWHWDVSEEEIYPEPVGKYDAMLDYMVIEIRTWRADNPGLSAQLQTLMLRRSQ